MGGYDRVTGTGALVIGDIMFDIIATPEPFRELADDEIDYTDAVVEFRSGGTGTLLARSALEFEFAPVGLLCSSGAEVDWREEMLIGDLERKGIVPLLNRASAGGVGTTVIGYFGTRRRMMFGAPGANVSPLDGRVVEKAVDFLSHSRVLIVSGYMLFRPTTFQGVVRIMQAASDRGVLVALDLLPHGIHKTFPLKKMSEAMRLVDVLAGSWTTLTALNNVKVASSEEYNFSSLAGLLDEFKAVLAHVPGYRSEFRSVGGFDFEVNWPASSEEKLRGHTDRVLVQSLSEYLRSIG